MTKKFLTPIKEIIKEAKRGKMFILVDDKNRENEGDLVIPASKCNSKNINFMATHGRGLICLALKTKSRRIKFATHVIFKQSKNANGIYNFDRSKKESLQEYQHLIELKQLKLQ